MPHRLAGEVVMWPKKGPAIRRAVAWTRFGTLIALGALLAVLGAGLYATRPLVEPAVRPLTSTGAVVLLGLGLAVSSFGLAAYVLAPGFRGRAGAGEGVGSHRLVLSSTLLVVVAANLGTVPYMLVRPAEGLCSVPGFLTAVLSAVAALCVVTYVRLIRPGVLTRSDLGLQSSRFPRDAGTGVLLGILVLAVSAAIQALLESLGVRQTQLVDFRCIKQFPLPGFLAAALAGGVMAPVAEELFFRGFVFRSYLRTRGPVVAYLFSSLLFASLHLNLPALLPILALGLIFCWAYHRTGSIIPGMVGHALNNSVAFIALYFSNTNPV